MSITLNLSSLYQQIESQLERVRTQVGREWTEAFRLVYGPSAAQPRLGGKLMRPAACLLSAGAAGADDLDHFVDMAAAMELLHLASLAHDDVVDSANLRRGGASLNAIWDNHTAVLGGDFLVARALTVVTVYDSCSVVASALESIHQMAEGELINFGVGKENLSEADTIRLAEKKTASLFAAACCTPTLLLDSEWREPLHAYGMGVGTAFQLIDDILDIEQPESTLGKPSCGDIVEGKVTLPIIYMKEGMEEAEIVRLDTMVGAELTAEDREWAAAMLLRTGARDRAAAVARKYMDDSRAALDSMPQNCYTEALFGMADFVMLRDS
ncbi:MAG: polyprenyl synthetase family protein [Candidatus Hydrogenedentes bacterium]|jgi:geranylgeranyl pyrophosphate synthase|nr:polyprenyl synthetase family protein [Candidatus Hydrogenedentota bacterium]